MPGGDIAASDIPTNSRFTLLSSHLLTRVLAQDRTSEEAGLISGELLFEAFTSHRDFVHSLHEIARVPSTRRDQALFLTHDHEQGTKSDVTVTVGVGGGFVGYSDGQGILALGSTNPDIGTRVSIFGSGTTPELCH